MNAIYKLYFWLPRFGKYLGIIGKCIDKAAWRMLKFTFDIFVPKAYSQTGKGITNELNTQSREKKIVVSMTSFPQRMDTIWITLESIFRQSVKPDVIELWLGDDRFPGHELPSELLMMEKRGLQIRWCTDLRSHTKYYYALQEHPDAIVITVDDDVYYPSNTLSELLKIHEKYPTAICSNRVHKVKTRRNTVLPYRKWEHNFCGDYVGSDLFLTGVGGVLYPPHTFDSDLFDKATFESICLYADDVWLYLHAVRNGVKIATSKTFNKDLITVSTSQKERLVMRNVHAGANDLQIAAVCEKYDLDLIKMIR